MAGSLTGRCNVTLVFQDLVAGLVVRRLAAGGELGGLELAGSLS